MIRMVEVYKVLNEYRLREVYINPKHVAAMRQDDRMLSMLAEGILPDGLEKLSRRYQRGRGFSCRCVRCGSDLCRG